MTKTEVHSAALNKTIAVDRIVGHIKGSTPGPTLIFMGGIHGNEPAGLFALQHVIEALQGVPIKGNLYAIAGNLQALSTKERYQTEDLNRMWTKERVEQLNGDLSKAKHQEEVEQMEINEAINTILATHEGPFYFFDMHTTSSETLPFLTVNDSLINRAFTSQYPLPIILGIEEFLDGPILSYINELGYVAFGFEAGQHEAMSAVENCVSFIYLSLVFSGMLKQDQIDFHKYYHMLAKNTEAIQHTYEIFFRYAIHPHEIFKMQPGFYNFKRIKPQELLADSNEGSIYAQKHARIFMPLYQSKGIDGFFMIRRIKPIFLRISALCRKYRLDRLLSLLPGVRWKDATKSSLMVDKRIARFFTKDIFHLFGFRSVKTDKNHYVMHNRESAARTHDYVGEEWMKL